MSLIFFKTGQVNTLTKLLKNEKTPLLRNLVLLPLLVQQEADSDIQVHICKQFELVNDIWYSGTPHYC